MNPFLIAAQIQKADAIVSYLDTQAQAHGLDLNTARAADLTAERLRNAAPDEIREYSAAASQNPASAETWARVVGAYELRAAMLAEPEAVRVGRVA